MSRAESSRAESNRAAVVSVWPPRRLFRAVIALVVATIFAASIAAAAEPSAKADPPPPVPQLRISEVMTDPLLLDDVAGEYVEVVNLGPGVVRRAELELELPSGKRAVPFASADSDLAPCAVLLLAPQPGPGATMVKAMRLPNRAGRLTLRWRGRVVDVVQWTGRWPWPKHRPGLALERRSPDADGTVGSSWRHARTPLRRVERGNPGSVGWRCDVAEAAAQAQRAPDAPVARMLIAGHESRARPHGNTKPRARRRARMSGPASSSTQRRAQSEWRLWEPMATLYSAATLSESGIGSARRDGDAIASLR